MSIPQIKGQDLIDLTNSFLAGYQGSLSSDTMDRLINEGKNRIWSIIKNLRANYFMTSSQSTDNTQDNYFANLTTTTREFTLPKDYHEMKFIENLSVGYEDIEFVHRDMATEIFKDARRGATIQPSGATRNRYLYDIIGKDQLHFAQYPEQPFNLVLWYVRVLPDITPDSAVPDILFPYVMAIAQYAAKFVMLSVQDTEQWKVWSNEWKDSVIAIAQSASPRELADPQMVQGFEGGSLW